MVNYTFSNFCNKFIFESGNWTHHAITQSRNLCKDKELLSGLFATHYLFQHLGFLTLGCSLTGTVTFTTSLMGFSLYTSTIWVSQLLGRLAAPDWAREISEDRQMLECQNVQCYCRPGDTGACVNTEIMA